MYRDFAAAIRDRPPARDEPRAGDRGSAVDGSRSTRRREAPMSTAHYDIVIIGSGAGGGTMAHALAGAGARDPGRRARRLRAAGAAELEPRRRCGRTCATARRSAGSTTTAPSSSPYTHYNVGGNTKFWGSVLYRLRREDFGGCSTSTACRRRGRSTTTRWRRTTTAPSACTTCTAAVGDDPTEPPRGPFPHPAVPHAPGMARLVDDAAGAGPASVAAAARADSPRRARRLPAVQHLQLVSLPAAREERRRGVRHPAGPGHRQRRRCGPARWRGGCSPTPSGRKVAGGRDRARRGAAER